MPPLYMNRDYIERRNYLKEKLESLGFELTAQPEGAFYIFPSIKRFTENDFEFCVDVLEKAHLAMVPGSSFTDIGKGYIRISYAYDMETLKKRNASIRKLFTATLSRSNDHSN